jgi:hypothetical protein
MAALVLQEHPEPCHAGNEWQASSPLAVPFRQTYPSELLQRLQSFLRGLLQASLLNCPKARPDDSTHSGSAMLAERVESEEPNIHTLLVRADCRARLSSL